MNNQPCVMLSMKPKWAGRIFDGRKNIEFRKRKPRVEVPFKAYIYCGKWHPSDADASVPESTIYGSPETDTLCISCPANMTGRTQTVVGEVIVDRIEIVTWDKATNRALYGGKDEKGLLSGGVSVEEFLDYQGTRPVYGLHIASVKYYKHPKKLSSFRFAGTDVPVKYPPQSFCLVNDLNTLYPSEVVE